VSAGNPKTDAILRVLDPDPDRASERYLELFERLTRYFRARMRGGAADAEDLAQETLRRGFSRILAGVDIYVDPAHYFFRIAKYVAIETWRSAPPETTVAIEDLPDAAHLDFGDVDTRICLEQCLRLLPDDEREALMRYQTEDHKALARALGLTEGTLRVKVHRAKNRLIALVRRAQAAVQPAETKTAAGSLKE
jgi:RNA polymerase sigma factor (sigma-70 family)